MSEQDMAWALGLLTCLIMVAGAVWLKKNNRTDKLESPIEPTSHLTLGADAKSQALGSQARELQAGKDTVL